MHLGTLMLSNSAASPRLIFVFGFSYPRLKSLGLSKLRRSAALDKPQRIYNTAFLSL